MPGSNCEARDIMRLVRTMNTNDAEKCKTLPTDEIVQE